MTNERATMKMEKIETLSNNFSTENPADASKLMSLLALAAGALAMPQTSNADIIFHDLSSSPVSVGPLADPSYTLDLPGTHQFSFRVRSRPGHQTSSTFHTVVAGQVGGGLNDYVNLKTTGVTGFVLPVGKSVLWTQINQPGLYRTGFVGNSNTYNGQHFPNAYDHQYLAFRFQDSTKQNAWRYGWVELSEHFPASGGGPEVTIFGSAWEDSGAQVATGVVPEPSTASLMALGALTLGAAGIRSWRRKRAGADAV